MGIETALILGGTALALAAGAALAFTISGKQGPTQEGLNPASLDYFNITQAREGAVVPIIYGRVRIPGNIVWYGDLRTEPIFAETAGGKGIGGGGGEETIQGYKYFISVGQCVCMGKANLIKVFIHDEDKGLNIPSTSYSWNDGTQNSKPYPESLEHGNKVPGVAHIFILDWYIGDNATNMPTIHFVVERQISGTVNYANLSNGTNPAAVIYDLFLQQGVTPEQIDLPSFNAAALFWYNKGYGLNLVFSSQEEFGQILEKVLGYVGGAVYIKPDGKYALRAFDPADVYQKSLSKEILKDFSLHRKTWEIVPNDFRATYMDENDNFTQRVVNAQNPAAIRLAGNNKIQQTPDLTCFRDLNTASKRLFEIMKNQSFPAAEIKFKTNLALTTLIPGDVIRISHDLYGIVSADFRVLDLQLPELESNEIGVSAIEVIESKFDDIYSTAGGSSWVNPDSDPINLTKLGVFELPQNYNTGNEPAYLLLFAREKLFEVGCHLLYSLTGSDYQVKGYFDSFSQYGTLAQAYNADTYQIDDSIGILYTPYKNDPIFTSLSRADLFGRGRLLVCGNELMGFQNVSAEGSNFRLRGIVRGVLNTPIESHPMSSPLWLVNLSERNVLRGINASSFSIKLLPIFGSKVLDASLATAQNIVYQSKALTIVPPNIHATRNGSTVSFSLYPMTWDKTGAGTIPENQYTSPNPIGFEGDFEVSYGVTTTYQSSLNFDLTLPSYATITVKHRMRGRASAAKIILIGVHDTTYYA